MKIEQATAPADYSAKDEPVKSEVGAETQVKVEPVSSAADAPAAKARSAGPISTLGVGSAAVLLVQPVTEVPAALIARRTSDEEAAAARARYLARKAEKKKSWSKIV